MQRLVLRLILGTAVAAVTAVAATALAVHVLGERERLRAGTEADLAAVVSLAESTSDREDLLRGIARTPAGREGRLGVHVDGATVGSSRLPAGAAATPAEVPVAGGVVLVRDAGTATVEAFVPSAAPGPAELGLAALLFGAGALATAAGAAVALRRIRPVRTDLAELTAGAAALGDDAPPPGRPMHVPETAALAAALAEATTAAAEARDRERRLAADLSHRLRTPLTALRINADSLEDSPTAERVRETVAALEKDVNALIHPAPATDEPGRCDVADVVQQRMAFWTTYAHKTGRDCRFTVQPPAVVALREDEVAAAVDDLLANIIRHTPDGTAFAVTVVRYAGWVTLVVDDAGPGVVDPAAALQRGVSELEDGTGLGLAIARHTVEAAGGTIHLERAELGGSRIRLRFPEAVDTRYDGPTP